MARISLPFSEVRRKQLLRRLIVAAVAAGAFLETGLYFGIHDLLRHSRLAVPLASYVVVSVALTWVYCAHAYFVPGYRSRLGWRLVIAGMFGVATGVVMLGFAQSVLPVPPPYAAAEMVIGTAVGTFYLTRWMRQQNLASLTRMSRAGISRRAAEETYEICRRMLGGRPLPAEQRMAVMLNLARAAIVRCTAGDAPGGLVEAMDVLRALLADPPPRWSFVMAAAVELADACFRKAGVHGDFAGYEDALGLLAATAERMPPDYPAAAVVHQKRAEYLLQRAGQLPTGPAAAEELKRAVAVWRAAIAAATPGDRDRLRVMHSDIGEAIARAYPALADAPVEIEIGITECRTSLRLAGRSARKRAPAQIRLAKLLVLRATERARDALNAGSASRPIEQFLAGRADVAEAQRLLRLAQRHGAADVRASAAPLLAAVATLGAVWRDLGVSRPLEAGYWRQAADAMAHADALERANFAQGWTAFAVASGEASMCAEAYWYLIRAIPDAVAVRYLAEERERVLAGMQSIAEEAGYWLAEAGRAGEAALALELGKAVSLTEILGRDRPGLEAALIQAGRGDLLRRYQTAVDDYGATAGPRSDEDPGIAQRAWSAYVEALHDATTAVGIDVPQELPTLSELAEAASAGPLVYLAAADRGGYAITVSAGEAPACLALPRLSRSALAGQLASFLAAPAAATGTRDLMSRIADTLGWIWDAGIGDLAVGLPAGALVTIVPIGLLSLLPVHAAGGPAVPGQLPEDWEFLADRVTVRYAPNARVLLRAKATAAALPDDSLSLLSVAAADALPKRILPYASREADLVWRQWHQPADQKPVTGGARSDVEPLLAGRTVWHFACHCHAEPDRILDSALVLAGGELSLRAILAMPAAPRRLAVLSACESHRSGTELPNEATGLPAGLIQAGFAGVVASCWPVKDRSTACLMARFHELWRREKLPPAIALAEAQRWCRTATRAEVRGYANAERGDLRLVATPWLEPTPGQPPDRPFRHPFFWAPFALTGG